MADHKLCLPVWKVMQIKRKGEKQKDSDREGTVNNMTVKAAVKLLQYGTDFEVKGAYSGKIYHSTRRNKRENLEKYLEKEVTDEPYYAKLTVDKDLEYCRPIIGIWMYDYDLCHKDGKDGENE